MAHTARSYYQKSRDRDRKSTRLNSSHSQISYAVFCLKKKKMIPYHLRIPRLNLFLTCDLRDVHEPDAALRRLITDKASRPRHRGRRRRARAPAVAARI